MPSPFPGMDPYLEDPGLWPDVHHRLITVAAELLTEQLRPKYYARIEERIYSSDEHDPARHVLAPDLRIVPARSSGGATAYGAPPATGAATADPVEVTTLIEDEIHESRIEVIDRSRRAVVAVIEILSPANKIFGARGRESYEQKREELMRSPSHFIEIDLLRAGAGFSPYEALPAHDYRVHLSRVQRRPRGLLWPIRMDQRLPVIPVPLHGTDPDGWLDLQAVLNAAYDRAGYDLELRYDQPPPAPALSPAQAQWVDMLLREKGCR